MNDWSNVFLSLQGRRLAWWASEKDLDEGKASQGQLLLLDYAGLTQPSPVDLREVEALGYYGSGGGSGASGGGGGGGGRGGGGGVVCVFGSDGGLNMAKLTVCCPDAASRDSLERRVKFVTAG